MKILILAERFPPQFVGASASRMHGHAELLAAKGHEVTVLTNRPHSAPQEEQQGQLRVLRVAGDMDNRYGFVRRVWNSFIFALSSVWVARRANKVDALLVNLGPPLNYLPALLIRWIKRAGIVVYYADPKLDEAIERSSWGGVLKGLSTFEMWILKSCEQVITVSHTMREVLVSRGVRRENTAVVPGGVDLELFAPRSDNETKAYLRESHNLPQLVGRFLLFYGGSMGDVLDLPTLLNTAEKVQALDSEIAFLLLGYGSQLEALELGIRERGLDNIVVQPPVQLQEYIKFVQSADVGLVLWKNEITQGKFPTKVFEFMAAGIPVVATDLDEVVTVFQQSGAGLAAKAGDAEDIVAKICQLKADRNLRADMSKLGPTYARERLDRSVLNRTLESSLQKAANER